nr:hypothetical protein [Candidatus Freyrarchaeum guaymaensis]
MGGVPAFEDAWFCGGRGVPFKKFGCQFFIVWRQACDVAEVPLLPWRLFHSWGCLMCGECCEKFEVSLTPSEAAFLVREYGRGVVERKGGRGILDLLEAWRRAFGTLYGWEVASAACLLSYLQGTTVSGPFLAS